MRNLKVIAHGPVVVVCDAYLLIVELNVFVVVVVDDDDVGSAIVAGFIDVTIADFGHTIKV